jgi:hypothetical protein
MNVKTSALVLVLVGWSTTLWASVIGLPQHTLKVGVASGAGVFKVSDPNGNTGQAFASQPVQLIISDWLKGPSKYWLAFYNQKYVLGATDNDIGQAVNQNGVRALVQYNIPLSRLWMPWVGAGFDLNYGEYRLRHHMDEDGFLTKRFADRSSPGAGLVFNMVSEWQVTRNLSAGFQLEQVLPMSNASRSTTATVLLMFNL